MQEPIDYERALKDLQASRTRRRVGAIIRRVLDPRPTSPGQVMLVGVALVAVGWLLPVFHLALLAGLALLAFGFLTSTFQPKSRVVTWRNRQIELPPEATSLHRLYYLIYRRRI